MSLEERCANHTKMAVRCTAMTDRHGREVVVVIAKLTYRVDPRGVVGLAEPRAVRVVSSPTSRDRWSSLKYPSDWIDEKPGTDIVLLASAYPRGGASYADVSFRLETGYRTIQKILRVHGPRVYQSSLRGVVPAQSTRMEPTPIIYELAHGGADEEPGGEPLVDYRNPAGRGVARDPRRLVGRPAAQIESPEAPLSSLAPEPAGLAALQPDWEPRASFAGTYDDEWRRTRSPHPPADFDARHNSVASPGLWSDRPLTGAEPMEIVGLTPEGLLRFQLPRHAPVISTSIAGISADHLPQLDTMLFDLEERCVELVWRQRFTVPKRLSQFEGATVTATPTLPSAVLRASA